MKILEPYSTLWTKWEGIQEVKECKMKSRRTVGVVHPGSTGFVVEGAAKGEGLAGPLDIDLEVGLAFGLTGLDLVVGCLHFGVDVRVDRVVYVERYRYSGQKDNGGRERGRLEIASLVLRRILTFRYC